MPLSEYTVPPVQELHVPKTDGVPRDKICTVTNQASMAGILTQITLITSYANEMFGNLVKEATETYSKIKDLSQRTQKLRHGLPEMEQFFSASDIISQMSSAKRSAYVSKNDEKSNLFDRESIPHALQTIYDAKCKPPPKLHLLDPYADDGKPVLTKYTYPQFFLDEWIAEQQKQVEILKAERRQRRKDRAARRREKAGKEGPDPLKPQVRKLRKVRYDPQTGERIIEEEDATGKWLTTRSFWFNYTISCFKKYHMQRITIISLKEASLTAFFAPSEIPSRLNIDFPNAIFARSCPYSSNFGYSAIQCWRGPQRQAHKCSQARPHWHDHIRTRATTDHASHS